MKTYKLSEVKQVCEVIYGKPICERTWLRWKRKLCLPKSIREISESQMEQLLTLANMKKTTPFDKITLTKVIESKRDALNDFYHNHESYKLYLLPDVCSGGELTNIIYMVTGRKVNQRTLYRWGIRLNCRYSTHTNYTKDEVSKFISEVFVDCHNR